MRYRYVGPEQVRLAAGTGPGSPLPAGGPGPYTYVVDLEGSLLLAPRQTEHVACASGRDVLAAGEISFAPDPRGGWMVDEVSNQSTGYCPQPSCWPAVAAALDRAGVRHPGGFTAEFEFRRCPGCGTLNLVKEGDLTCAVCEGPLPEEWNVGGTC
ncbi:hypothetical protein [Actinoplanes sp. NPDC023714]|uniref:hypothetical protein n=1 Tax=Actinoplanes sp. NPDC023714 TaxID=3154322 RepID=UPI0033FDBD64